MHKLACARVFAKMNEGKSFYESRGSWKKVKGDLENDAPQKLADLSLMWEKITGSTTGKILQCKNHEPNAMVKGALMSRKEKAIETVSNKKRERTKCIIKSCGAMPMPSARIKCFATNMPNQSTRRNVLIVMRSLPKLVVGYAEVV